MVFTWYLHGIYMVFTWYLQLCFSWRFSWNWGGTPGTIIHFWWGFSLTETMQLLGYPLKPPDELDGSVGASYHHNRWIIPRNLGPQLWNRSGIWCWQESPFKKCVPQPPKGWIHHNPQFIHSFFPQFIHSWFVVDSSIYAISEHFEPMNSDEQPELAGASLGSKVECYRIYQWIGWREKLQENFGKPVKPMGKFRLSCRFFPSTNPLNLCCNVAPPPACSCALKQAFALPALSIPKDFVLHMPSWLSNKEPGGATVTRSFLRC